MRDYYAKRWSLAFETLQSACRTKAFWNQTAYEQELFDKVEVSTDPVVLTRRPYAGGAARAASGDTQRRSGGHGKKACQLRTN